MAGVRVIDFGQYIAGPLAAMILADLGAEVVRVDPPAGPSWHHPATNLLNRNKRSIALDLNLPGEVEIARRLIATADVVIENFRPGVMERFGLGGRDLMAAFPRLVYLSLPGFASGDAEVRTVPAWEGIISAAIGQFTDMSLTRVLMGKKASFSPLPLASTYGAVPGAMAVVLALYSRLASGRGDLVEVPLAAALAEGLAFRSMRLEGLPSRYLGLREREIARRQQAGEPLNVNYDEVQSYLGALYRRYRCADGRHFYLASNSHINHPRRALALLGLLEEVTADGLPTFDPWLPTCSWASGADCTLGDVLSTQWNKILTKRIAAVFEREPSSHWEAFFGEKKVPGATVRNTQEWLKEVQPLEAGLLIDVEDRRYGLMRQPANVAWLGDIATPRPLVRPAPALNADRERILEELREAEPDLRGPASMGSDASAARGCRDGITILDLTNVLAGPTIAGTLQRHAILCQIDALGGPTGGPWRNRIGFDEIAQSVTGVMARYGGGLQTPEDHTDVGTIDVLTGYAGALATAIALYARQRGVNTHLARASLVATAQLIQLPFMYDHPNRPPFNEPSGPDARGTDPFYRCYETADGWLFVACKPNELPAITSELGIDITAEDLHLEQTLERAFASKSVEAVCAHVRAIGVAAQKLENVERVRERYMAERDGGSGSADTTLVFQRDDHHPSGHRVELIGRCALRFARAVIRAPTAAPKPGANSRSVLAELEYTEQETGNMLTAQEISESWSDEYLPS
nr:CoA transferase [Bradyrhizobium sp. 23]